MSGIFKAITIGQPEEGFPLLLDGCIALTPAKRPLLCLTSSLAEKISAEWRAFAGKCPDPSLMPVTRIHVTRIDHLDPDPERVKTALFDMLQTDLLLYHPEESSVSAQDISMRRNRWLAWAEKKYGISFNSTTTLRIPAQPPALLQKLGREIEALSPSALVCLWLSADLCHSPILGLAFTLGLATDKDLAGALFCEEISKQNYYQEESEDLANEQARVEKELRELSLYLKLASWL